MNGWSESNVTILRRGQIEELKERERWFDARKLDFERC